MFNQEILTQYNKSREQYAKLIPEVEKIINQSLEEQGIKCHGISYRTKEPESLAGKLERPDKIYRSLQEITDLVGFRIVTYFEEDIDLVGRMVESLFFIDYDHSIDKRQIQNPNYFGYRSLHYVCRLKDDEQISFEIQIRTILQHTWAEIEHDLGYKFPESVPIEIRRRFSRLAGLLELADQEFSTIRAEIYSYEKSLTQGRLEEVPLSDELGLRSIVNDDLIKSFELEFANHWNQNWVEELFYPPYLIKMLSYCHLETKSKVVAYLEAQKSKIFDFAKRYSKFTSKAWGFTLNDFPSLKAGYSLFLLAHFKIFNEETLEINKLEIMKDFYLTMDYPGNNKEALRIAKIFLEHCSTNA